MTEEQAISFLKRIFTVQDLPVLEQNHITYTTTAAIKEHQRIIGRLMTALGGLYYRDEKMPYEPFIGVMIDESQTSPLPDILLFDHATRQNVVIIEVSSTAGMKRDFEMPEAFVYDYGFQTWRKYQPDAGEIIDRPFFCRAIEMDLAELLTET